MSAKVLRCQRVGSENIDRLQAPKGPPKQAHGEKGLCLGKERGGNLVNIKIGKAIVRRRVEGEEMSDIWWWMEILMMPCPGPGPGPCPGPG